MEFLIALIIFGASVAVYKDAITNNIARPALGDWFSIHILHCHSIVSI